MTHLQTCLANEAAVLSAKALAHRIAAKSGVEVLTWRHAFAHYRTRKGVRQWQE